MKLIRLVRSCLAFVVFLGGCRLWESEHYERLTFAPGQKAIRVLMVGDSLTYYNDLPGILQELSVRQATPIYIERVTFPLRSLEGHWDAGTAVEKIRIGHFDYVVLQDFSRKPATDPEDCLKYYQLFDAEIRRAGGHTIIFQNWTRAGLEADYFVMERTYQRIHEHIEAPIAPIGAAWKRCREQHPEIELLIDDRHPTNAGSYLAACVLYDTLYQTHSASALPVDLPAPKLGIGEIKALRSIADETR